MNIFGGNEEEKYDFFWLWEAELRNFAKQKIFGYKYTTFVSDNLLPTSFHFSVSQDIIICSAKYFQTNDKKEEAQSFGVNQVKDSTKSFQLSLLLSVEMIFDPGTAFVSLL